MLKELKEVGSLKGHARAPCPGRGFRASPALGREASSDLGVSVGGHGQAQTVLQGGGTLTVKGTGSGLERSPAAY